MTTRVIDMSTVSVSPKQTTILLSTEKSSSSRLTTEAMLETTPQTQTVSIVTSKKTIASDSSTRSLSFYANSTLNSNISGSSVLAQVSVSTSIKNLKSLMQCLIFLQIFSNLV